MLDPLNTSVFLPRSWTLLIIYFKIGDWKFVAFEFALINVIESAMKITNNYYGINVWKCIIFFI